jgi:hypothetical protein
MICPDSLLTIALVDNGARCRVDVVLAALVPDSRQRLLLLLHQVDVAVVVRHIDREARLQASNRRLLSSHAACVPCCCCCAPVTAVLAVAKHQHIDVSRCSTEAWHELAAMRAAASRLPGARGGASSEQP